MGTAARDYRGLTSAVIVAILVLSGCSRGPSAEEGSGSGDGDSTNPSTDAAIVESQAAVAPLTMGLVRDSVVCDGLDHEVGVISGARPRELLVFSSAVPINIAGATTDDAGTYRLNWSCDPSEARLRWEMTATGHDSGSAVTFTLVGASTDSPEDGGLAIDVVNTGFTCDGITRKIGTLSGADPNEQINFTSRETANLRPGDADQYGDLKLNWECEPDDAGTTWNVTAVGVESGRTGVFAIGGIAVDVEAVEPLSVEVLEEPFVCDGSSRDVATIKNFAPFEVVDFSSAEADALIDGRADGLGELTARWQCGLSDVGTTWQLNALGVLSQRSVTMTITGAAPPAESGTELTVALTEDPFACDGASRPFATIGNFLPGEFVNFSSPQSEALRQGQADDIGGLSVRWQCGAGDIDKIWDLTATGAASGKSITFRVTGAGPPAG